MDNYSLCHMDLGAVGWLPADWLSHFYPDDLPKEWRITYYSNEFRRIFLPASQRPNDPFLFEAWQDEVADNFEFYLQIDHALIQDSGWPVWQQVFADNPCSAIITDKELLKPAAEVFCSVDLWEREQTVLQPLYHRDDQVSRQLAILSSSTVMSATDLQQLFLSWQQSVSARSLYLFVDMPLMNLTKIRQMCELYGW